MNYILFDGTVRKSLLPLTYTKPVADLRIGILTIREKWESYLGFTTTTLTEDYLEEKFPMVEMEQNVMINASFLPTLSLVEKIMELKENQAIFKGEEVIAFFTVNSQETVNFDQYEQLEFESEVLQIKNTWDLFSFNEIALKADFELITEGRKSQPIPEGVRFINKENIFIEEGAEILFSVLNASKGPIYIGKNALVMEGSLIRGPFAMGENSVVKMGAKIYGATTIGPYCTVGGEINNSILSAYSNKGHDGFLGNSVLGEWCNIGADTNNSNLKNNYSEVRLWNYETENFAKTGLQFCGLIMGDHSKCAINTMFNTGTVIGVSANIYGSNFPRNFIPSFSWGGAAGFSTYQLDKVNETVKLVMKRRNVDFDEKEKRILEYVFDITEKYRNSFD
ncbi:MAG: glucose-1-phosphate thymidylyltransferase [Bacteroidetes bacterium HGW-Bacteroidetes-3]|jgi:UDP-N-acetylglucosamine diphosphorylase/glucosamine-1-phosphate N-acetyltransferase|nr:MAG: glucose-1-phosphate thymidylyltransferase [Bacteroidetes bacterium HGW-Bacteroidetes-3]